MRKKSASIAILLAGAGLLAGLSCREQRKLTPSGAGKRADIKLRLVVVGDAPLARAGASLKAEWHARAGSSFEVVEVSVAADRMDEPLKQLETDVIVCQAAQLGELVEAERVVPMPSEILSSEELALADIYPLVQQGAAMYGGKAYATSLGTPVLTLCYRRDLFEKFGRPPPRTWQEYQAECEFFADAERITGRPASDTNAWQAAVEPLAGGWAGQMLLARAAAYARHRDNYSTLFSIDDLEPLIDKPPFVRALEELVAAAKSGGRGSGSAGAATFDSAGARAALMAGRCAMAITWPTAAREVGAQAPLAAEVAFAELPGAPESYNFSQKAWDTRQADESIHVPLVPVAGRIAVVTRSCKHPLEAFKLLAWLAGPTWGARVGASSPDTTLYRRSQAAAPQKWVEPLTSPAAAKQYAEVTAQALSRPMWMHALRIPGWQAYQLALDSAVADALAGKNAAEALHGAAGAWREISQRLGREKQLPAYRRSLGLD